MLMIYERCMYFLYSRRCLGVMFILASNKWHAGMPAHFTGVNVSYGAPLCFLSTLFDRSFPVTLAKHAPTVCIVACIEHRSVRNLRTTFFDQVILLKCGPCNQEIESFQPISSQFLAICTLHVHSRLLFVFLTYENGKIYFIHECAILV